MFEKIIGLCAAMLVAAFAGYAAGTHKMDIIKAQSDARIAAIAASSARISEDYEKLRNDAVAVAVRNAAILDGMRRRISSAGSAAAGGSDAASAGKVADLAERVLELADFSQRCSQRCDECAAQLTSLQGYVRSLQQQK